MTGMKEGAGEDPFADDESESNEPDERTGEATETRGSRDTESVNTAGGTGEVDGQSMQIPYKFRRDSVHDNRDRVPLFLQEDTKTNEREAVRELEDRFGDNVSLTDLREATMLVGLAHLDEVQEHLEEWGYGMTFE
jgi:hypothetical protein